MNVTNEKVQGQKNGGNRQKLFSFIIGGCEHFQSFGVHSNMSVESVIEKL
jgi:hypothetical protein